METMMLKILAKSDKKNKISQPIRKVKHKNEISKTLKNAL